jgi:hypothetical protein
MKLSFRRNTLSGLLESVTENHESPISLLGASVKLTFSILFCRKSAKEETPRKIKVKDMTEQMIPHDLETERDMPRPVSTCLLLLVFNFYNQKYC